MKSWIVLALCTTVLGTTAARAERHWTHTLGEPASATAPPVLYMSTDPNICFTINGLEFWLYAYSPDDADFTGFSVDLALDGYNLTPALVTPGPGVVLDSVSVWPSPFHIEATWTPRTLEHEPICKLQFFTDPQLQGDQKPTNVTFTRGGGATVPGVGWWTFAGCCVDCFPCSFGFNCENHVYVPAGNTATIPFEYGWYCWTSGGGTLTVSDTEGWVTSWTPATIGDIATCGFCVVPQHPGSIEVSVPPGVANGTTSIVTLSTTFNDHTFAVEAVEPVPVEHKTWGAIKALYNEGPD